MRLIHVVAASLLLLGSARGLGAQASPDSVIHRNDCRLASQVLTHGQPENKRAWALGYVLRCGATGGEAIARVILANRDHTTEQETLEQVVMLASVFRDAAIFEAAASVALDATAGKVSRIQAIRTLYFQIRSGYVDPYESFLAGAEMTYLPLSDWSSIQGTTLPADAPLRALRIAEAVAASRADMDVCAAAQKLAGGARAEISRAGP